ncbi:MAG: right-handed parallel beta-helix repeat-containing protein [Planctomycetota bacterium]
MKRTLTAGMVLAALLLTSISRADTIYVNGTTGNDAWDGLCQEWDGDTCGPKATIKAGIGATVNGDTVLVADGTYTGGGNKNLDFGGRAITVRSENGSDSCIIDSEDNGRGFSFQNGEGVDSVVDGLTIRNGWADYGGGVGCWEYSSPTITNCTISGNSAYLHGGGVHCYSSSPTITNCTISGNSAERGGVYCYDSSPTITNCTISGNSADLEGGGVGCGVYRSPTIADCTISGNSADYAGGGVGCWEYSSPTITNCTISGNSSNAFGGGGVYCYYYSSPTITNCTISGNSTTPGSGGVFCLVSSSPTITNCILWNDTTPEISGDGSLVVTYCDIQGGWDGEGNIDDDPLFVDPDGPDDDPDTWEDNDYHLDTGSPCIDTGDPAFEPEPGETDIDGELCVWDGDDDGVARVDMGADEYGSYAVGNMNCEGIVNVYDIDGFILAVSTYPGFEEYYALYPDCDPMLADVNFDGAVNAYDIDGFIALVGGG